MMEQQKYKIGDIVRCDLLGLANSSVVGRIIHIDEDITPFVTISVVCGKEFFTGQNWIANRPSIQVLTNEELTLILLEN